MPRGRPDTGPRHRWRNAIRIGTDEFAALLAVLVFAALTLTFAVVADEMRKGETHAFDNAVILALRNTSSDPIGPPWLEEAARDITGLGGQGVLTLVTATAIGYLILSGARSAALLVFVTVAGGSGLVGILKGIFGRVRPDLVPQSVYELTRSFPSGHSTLAAVTYLTLGALLARVQHGHTLKLYVLSIAILVTLLIGVTRVYLGLHWPTDVLAGWCVGSAWALACWVITARLQRIGRVERQVEN
jgi:undecaprenyl-diphosphatase